MYTKEFRDYVKLCENIKTYVGLGMPKAKILIIGKEAAIPAEDKRTEGYRSNADLWYEFPKELKGELACSHKGLTGYLSDSWGKNTWSKYQRLYDYIDERAEHKKEIDFLEHCFTTEMNDSPSKTTAKANKESIAKRKNLFKESAFIQSFPVVILACSNYITNNDKLREIDDIFGVTYAGDEVSRYYSSGNWFYLHYNADKTKLVIHTRQLSTNVKNELLQDMASVIREFLSKH